MKVKFDHLQGMFDKKNSTYGSAYKKFGDICRVLFPEGLHLKTEQDYTDWGLYIQFIEKAIRIGNIRFNGSEANYESLLDSCDDISVVAQIMKAEFSESKVVFGDNLNMIKEER